MRLIPPSDSSPDGESGGWRPRSDADLLEAQLRALAEWHRRFAPTETADVDKNREARLDAARRQAIAESEREALRRWAERALSEPYRFGAGSVPRAVIAHRHDWLRAKLRDALGEHGVETIGSTADGAEAAAAIVIEQPDLVFVEDLLPTIPGIELIRRTRLLAPDAVVAAHALGPGGDGPLQEAGARATFSRRIPPADIAAQLVGCLRNGQVGTPTHE
jgi:CheY-like chemotaxis protein